MRRRKNATIIEGRDYCNGARGLSLGPIKVDKHCVYECGRKKSLTDFGPTPLKGRAPGEEPSYSIVTRGMENSGEAISKAYSKFFGQQSGPPRVMCARRSARGLTKKYGGKLGRGDEPG